MIWFIFLLGFFLRLIALNQSLWLDESTTARVVQTFNFPDIVQKFSPTDFHPPLYYFFMKFWTNFSGYFEISLRFPSIIFSLLAGWFVYLIGKELKDKKTGMWAAVFFLFNPLIIYYSQEARMYMMVTFFLTGAIYYGIRSMSKFSPQALILANLFLFLSVATFYGSIFFIAALYLYLLTTRQLKLLFGLLPGPILGLLSLAPLLAQQLRNSQVALQAVSNWSLVLGKANLKNLLLIPLKFSIGRISFEPKILYYGISGAWTILVFYFATKGARSKKAQLLPFLFLAPLILGFLASFFTPLLQYFRFLYLIPILSLFISNGAKTSFSRGILLAGFLVFSLVYLLFPQFHREDWKSLSQSLPEDSVVYILPSSKDPLLYYRKDLKTEDLRGEKKETSVIVVPYVSEIYGYDYRRELMKGKYRLLEEKAFRGLTYERWSL